MGLQTSCGDYPEVAKDENIQVLRKHLGTIFRELARHKEVVEGRVCQIIPPKYVVRIVQTILGLGQRLFLYDK
mgnify:CR=1 FL=1